MTVRRPSDDDNEFGGPSCSSSLAKRSKSDVERIEEEERSDCNIVHTNQPILMEVYRDPVTEKDKVIVVASMLGGTTDVEFSLLGSGPGTTQAQITYKWAPLSFNIEKLFGKDNKKGTTPSCHPKIEQLKKVSKIVH